MRRRPSGRFALLPRKKKTHKGDYGHALIVAGSDGMPGAAILASRAALISGAGLVTLATTTRVAALAARATPELITLPGASCDGAMRSSAYAAITRYANRRGVKALAVGPGLTTAASARSVVRRLVSGFSGPLVLDADGLNAFQGDTAPLRTRRGPMVLTPHEGELRRVFGVRAPAKMDGRLGLAKKLAAFYDVILVLKGHRTIVAGPRQVYVNATGNPGMAKGGSGDVLTGVVAAFLAQGLAPFQAAAWAVYFHGLAGDLAVKKTGELSLTASDLIEYLPAAFKRARV